MQLYFMACCVESLPQSFSDWKLNWRWRDSNPKPSKYQSNVLPTELSWLNYTYNRLRLSMSLTSSNFSYLHFVFISILRYSVLTWRLDLEFYFQGYLPPPPTFHLEQCSNFSDFGKQFHTWFCLQPPTWYQNKFSAAAGVCFSTFLLFIYVIVYPSSP